jgi:hypothetical protein
MKIFEERAILRSTLSRRVTEQKELLFEVFRGLTVSPASNQRLREEAQPTSAVSV